MSGTAQGSPAEVGAVGDLLDAMPEALVLLDLDGRVTHVNSAAHRIAPVAVCRPGVRMPEVADDPTTTEDLVRTWARSGTRRPGAISIEGRRLRCDGSRVAGRDEILVRLREPGEAGDDFARVATEVEAANLRELRRRLEATVEDLHRTNRLLTAANEELEQYASAVSHDVRTPLVTIRGFADLLHEEVDQEGRGMVDAIGRAAERVERIVEGLLAVARLESRPTPSEPVDSRVALDFALQDLTGQIEAAEAEIVTGDLPQVVVDRTALTQVFANLVANSLRYRNPGQAARIEIRAERLDGFVEFTVRDNGIGVPLADQERVFDLFRRATNIGESEGTGIGLATSKKLVTRWGGNIRCRPVSGAGALFSFTAPVPA